MRETKLGGKENVSSLVSQMLGIIALALFRAAMGLAQNRLIQATWGHPIDPGLYAITFNLDEGFVIFGTLVGLFLSTLAILFALLLGHDPGPMVSLDMIT